MTDFSALLWQRGHWGQTLGCCVQGARCLDQPVGDNILKTFLRANCQQMYSCCYLNISTANTSNKNYLKRHIPSSKGAAAFQGIGCKQNKE